MLLCVVAVSGCVGNIPQRPFVPLTSSDDMGENKEENKRRGEIGKQVCENNSLGLCAIECQYDGEETVSRTCDGDDKNQIYKLFVVEIDEQGRFYDDRQFHYLLDYLTKKEKLQDCGDGKWAKKGVSIVTVVHGWRHNAISNDSNVEDIRSILRAAYQSEKASSSLACGPREIIGVFVGWRGKSLSLGMKHDPLELLSFWDRKNTAHNVAMGSVRELLSVLQQFVRYRDEYREERKENDKTCKPGVECKLDRLIIVGHSFGGLIVFNALSEGLLNSITNGMFKAEKAPVEDHIYPPKVRLNADLIVLVNPAIEGIRLEPIYQAIKRRDIYYGEKKGSGFNKYQNPVFIAITAENDWATRRAFPWARFFFTIFEDKHPTGNRILLEEKTGNLPEFKLNQFVSDDTKKYSLMNKEECEASNKTMGHIPRYWTHKLSKVTHQHPEKVVSCLPQDKSNIGDWIREFESASEKSQEAYYKNRGQDFIYYCGDIGEKRSIQLSYLTQELRQRDLKKNEHESLPCLNLTGGVSHVQRDLKKDEYESLPYNSPVWIINSDNTEILDSHSGYQYNDSEKKLVIPFIQMLYHQLIANPKLQDVNIAGEAQSGSKTEPSIEKNQ
jgi:hypothetical protein